MLGGQLRGSRYTTTPALFAQSNDCGSVPGVPAKSGRSGVACASGLHAIRHLTHAVLLLIMCPHFQDMNDPLK